MRKVRLIVLILFTVVFLSISTSCNISDSAIQEQPVKSTYQSIVEDSADAGPVKGGELSLFTTIPDTFNPLTTNNIYVQDFTSLIFESLVKLDKQQKPIPSLSDGWTVSADGLSWNFHIREKVYWQDGSTLSALDVEHSMSVILDAANNSVYRPLLSNIATFGVIDRNNLKIRLKKLNYFTAEQMVFPIISKKALMKTGLNALSKPIGTGPYRFDDYKKSITQPFIVLKRNQNWWKKKNPDSNLPDLPYIDTIKVKVYKESKASINSFLSKNIDVTYVNSNDYDKYSSRSDITIKKYPSRNFEFLAFNTTKPNLKDTQLRMAISKLLDVNKIVTSCYGNTALQSDYPLYPSSWIWGVLKPMEKDANKGREILNQFKNRKLQFDLIINDDSKKRALVAEEIANQLKLYDINVSIIKLPWEGQLRRIQEGKFDIALMGFNLTTIPDLSYLYSIPYLSTNYNNEPLSLIDRKVSNIAKYLNNDVDFYIQSIFTQRDSGMQQAYFKNLTDILKQEIPYLGLCFTNNAILANRKIRGKIEPLPWNRLNNVAEWYIPSNEN